MKKKDILYLLVCAGILAVYLSNLWRLDLYPFTDLPNHLAEAYLLRALSDPASPLHAFYSIQVTPLTTASLHAYFCSLFADVETGNRIFYTAYLLLLPLCMILLVRSAGGNRWVALLSVLFLYNFSMMEGFSTFTLGIALALMDLFLLVRFLDRPGLPRAIPLAVIGLVLFYAHAVIFTFIFAVSAIVLLSRKGLTARERLLGLAMLAPACLLTAAWLLGFQSTGNEPSFMSFLASYYRQDYLPSLFSRVTGLLADNKQVATRPFGQILALLFVAPLLAGAAAFGLRNKFTDLLALEDGSKHTALVFLGVAGLCYLILPDHLPGWSYFYQRFSVFVFLALVWITSWSIPPRFVRSAQALAVGIVILHAGLWFQYFSDFNRLAQPFHSLLYHSDKAAGRTLSALIDDYDFRGYPVFIHYQNYQLIWNRGAVPTAITDYRFRLVQRQPGLPPYQEWVHNESYAALLGQYTGEELILSHGAGPKEFILRDSRYVLLDQKDDWALFEKQTKSKP